MVNLGKYTSPLDPMGIRPFFLADGCKAAGCFSTLIHYINVFVSYLSMYWCMFVYVYMAIK